MLWGEIWARGRGLVGAVLADASGHGRWASVLCSFRHKLGCFLTAGLPAACRHWVLACARVCATRCRLPRAGALHGG
jgi:hypothetical protein